jgi:6-phosphogluconolactonase
VTEQPNQSVVVMPIRGDGGLDPATASAVHTGETGPQMERQERPHTHAVIASLDNRFIIASDLGLDQLVVYRFDEGDGSIARIGDVALPPGSGPRHFVFHPSGDIIYAVNELNSTVASLSFDVTNGRAAVLAVASTEPAVASLDNRCSEIQMSPDGRFLFVGNRGNDNLSVFQLGDNGALSLSTVFSSGGKTPRHFSFDPSGRFLAVANQDSNFISIFDINLQTREFLPMGVGVPTGTPTHVCFCRL